MMPFITYTVSIEAHYITDLFKYAIAKLLPLIFTV